MLILSIILLQLMEENDKDEIIFTRWMDLEISRISGITDPNVGFGLSPLSFSLTPRRPCKEGEWHVHFFVLIATSLCTS